MCCFRTPERLAELEEFLKQNCTGKVDGAKKLVIDEDALCPICLEVPEPGTEMKMCVDCGNTFCELCRSKISVCPMCRVSFISSPPIRNRKAEILNEKFWKQ